MVALRNRATIAKPERLIDEVDNGPKKRRKGSARPAIPAADPIVAAPVLSPADHQGEGAAPEPATAPTVPSGPSPDTGPTPPTGPYSGTDPPPGKTSPTHPGQASPIFNSTSPTYDPTEPSRDPYDSFAQEPARPA
jgi:hypothetical protein